MLCRQRKKAVSSYSLLYGDARFSFDIVWSLSDAVTRLAFESTDYSGGSYNRVVESRFVYINNNVFLCASDCSALCARLPGEPACFSPPSH